MISIKIKDVNNFIHKMLLEDTFDNFLVSNISIQSYTDFSISGTINKNYYTEESKEAFDEHLYWKDLKRV